MGVCVCASDSVYISCIVMKKMNKQRNELIMGGELGMKKGRRV